MLKSFWKDPVWSAVIAAGLTAAGGALGTYFLGLWPTFAKWTSSSWSLAIALTPTPNWLLAFLVFTALVFLGIVAVVAWALLVESKPNSPHWTSYREDKFFGLSWRWRYVHGTIEGLNTFCPHCDYQVYAQDASSFAAVERIGYRCDSCERELGLFSESRRSLESKVERFIQQKIRNGSWSASGA